MTKFIVGLALVLACAPALAQKKMYRCGNVFQERPCEGPKQGPAEAKASPAVAKEQELAAKREERDKAAHQKACDGWNDDLGDVRTRLKSSPNARVTDELQARERELVKRLGRECK